MKNLIVGAVLTTLATSAAAVVYGPQNPMEWEKIYSAMIDRGVEHGASMEEHCFPDYCARSMVFNADDGEVIFLANVMHKNGVHSKQMCMGTNQARRCWFSDGRIIDERMGRNMWDTARVIARNFP